MNKQLAIAYKMQTGQTPFRYDVARYDKRIADYVDVDEVPTPEYLEWLEELALKSLK